MNELVGVNFMPALGPEMPFPKISHFVPSLSIIITGSSPSTGLKESSVPSGNFLSKDTAKFFSALPATTI